MSDYQFEPTYYETLGITDDANLDTIKKNYKTLALKNHPDKYRDKSIDEQQAANDRFVLLANAFRVLSDTDGFYGSRQDYDKQLQAYRASKNTSGSATQPQQDKKATNLKERQERCNQDKENRPESYHKAVTLCVHLKALITKSKGDYYPVTLDVKEGNYLIEFERYGAGLGLRKSEHMILQGRQYVDLDASVFGVSKISYPKIVGDSKLRFTITDPEKAQNCFFDPIADAYKQITATITPAQKMLRVLGDLSDRNGLNSFLYGSRNLTKKTFSFSAEDDCEVDELLKFYNNATNTINYSEQELIKQFSQLLHQLTILRAEIDLQFASDSINKLAYDKLNHKIRETREQVTNFMKNNDSLVPESLKSLSSSVTQSMQEVKTLLPTRFVASLINKVVAILANIATFGLINVFAKKDEEGCRYTTQMFKPVHIDLKSREHTFAKAKNIESWVNKGEERLEDVMLPPTF